MTDGRGDLTYPFVAVRSYYFFAKKAARRREHFSALNRFTARWFYVTRTKFVSRSKKPMKIMKSLFLIMTLPLLLAGCGHSVSADTELPDQEAKLVVNDRLGADPFAEYWYAGKAEVNSYDLSQSRYGENRNGDAVLVFVTEPFSQNKQVKLDDPDGAGEDRVTVLKTNFLRRFHTGIYDYSTMLSVFTPVSTDRFPHTLKSTFGAQDWCGQVFEQINLDDDEYRIRAYSYFEQEGDTDQSVDVVMLEDELFNRIRLNPETIPEGNRQFLPGSLYARLLHREQTPKQARVTKTDQGDRTLLAIEYLHIPRTLTITYQNEFPHRILQWSEEDGEHTTTARLRESIQSPYWQQNSRRYAFMRDSLQLLY